MSIQNYAIIDELEIEFSGKLNVITGETGAGKSIIVGAMALILGERADSTVLLNKERKCFVEGIFNVKNKVEAGNFLAEHDLEVTDEIIIRREIAANGRSRAFINDSPVGLSELTYFSSLLVDLHQQFDALELNQSYFQREVLDALAGHDELVTQYNQAFRDWQAARKERDDLLELKQRFERESDYNQFQFDELEEANFREDELEQLDAELKLLSSSEEIKSALEKVYHELHENEKPVVHQLKSLYNQLASYSSHHPAFPALLQRLQSSQIELRDIAEETERIANHIQFDKERIDEINNRLSTGYKLLKKHGVKTTNDLLEIRRQLSDRLQAVFAVEDQLRQQEIKTIELFETMKRLAIKISDGRKKQVVPFEQKINSLLGRVGMPNALLKVDLQTNNELALYGGDRVEFVFDPNLGGKFQPLRKLASGGELSRLMLCIKSLVAESVDLPTMIFDEIDTGISGEAARQVGLILKDLTRKRQVICITHQAQIAGRADAHFFVYKDVTKGTVSTRIRRLNTEERIAAIAQMLSGEKPTAAAMENAKELMMN